MSCICAKPYTISFDEKTGAISAIQNGNDVLQLQGSIWKIETANRTFLSIYDMTEFTCNKENNSFLFQWKNDTTSVKMTVYTEDEKLKMKLALVCHQKINRVQFPIYQGIEKISEEDDYVTLPFQNGYLFKNPVDTLLHGTEEDVPFWMGRGGNKYENDYPAQYSYQFFAYYNADQKGYYMASEDGNAYIKTIGLHYNADVNGMDMIFTNYPEGMDEAEYYAIPYAQVFCFFHGDWQTAAHIYRNWAIKQKWCTPLSQKNLSEDVKKIDFFRINHEHYALGTRSEEYIKTAEIMRDRLNCTPSMHWYGWNKAPMHGDWYPEMADYTNKAWHDELVSINKRLTEAGVYKIPYVNVHLWDDHLTSFQSEHAEDYLVMGESRKIEEEPWGTKERHILYPVCHAAPAFKNKAVRLFDRIVNEDGFDGIYIDQVGSFNATLCYNPKHGHPVGGGNWWAEEYQKMIGTFRETMPSNKYLTTESCCECYHNLFDLMLLLDSCSQSHGFYDYCGVDNCDSIPLFAMIYNDSSISYGSVCRFDNNNDQFEYNYIRNIMWGMIPTAEGMELEEISNDDTKWAILRRGVDFYKENKEVLLYGSFDAYHTFDCGAKPIAFGKNIKKCPGVICAEYTLNGQTYAFAYNYSDDVQTVEVKGIQITVNPKSFGSAKLA